MFKNINNFLSISIIVRFEVHVCLYLAWFAEYKQKPGEEVKLSKRERSDDDDDNEEEYDDEDDESSLSQRGKRSLAAGRGIASNSVSQSKKSSTRKTSKKTGKPKAKKARKH